MEIKSLSHIRDMTPKQKIFALAGLVGIVAIIVVAVFVFKDFKINDPLDDGIGDQVVSTSEPMDIVSDFYDAWLDAAKSTSTDPYSSLVASSPILSTTLRTRLEESQTREQSEPDPVLCLNELPERIKSKVVFQVEDKAQILVKSSDFDQAVVTLLRHNDGWFITSKNLRLQPESTFEGNAVPFTIQRHSLGMHLYSN